LQRLISEDPGEPPDGGFEKLPEKWRNSAYTVCYFYDYLGTLAANKIIDEKLIIGASSFFESGILCIPISRRNERGEGVPILVMLARDSFGTLSIW
jgi:hypothetical protein